ncbi:MAG: isoprenylcysteine carboxylmethyltransferase family protein [Acidobacteria bacterium]|nr:isoprenylcysteine carboxylmethyltransferase family protein [Acidobacteriota bacterium]
MVKRILGFAYGVVSYVIFLISFLYAIAFVGGGNLYVPGHNFIVPRSIDISSRETLEPLAMRLIIDALLLSLFALQHSVMARPWFKKKWTQVVAPMLERSTYVLLSSLILLLMFWQWRPIGTMRIAWEVQNSTGRLVLEGWFWVGWLIVLLSTFLIDHFDLFGLKQAYCYWQGKECPPPVFKERALYKSIRHPIMLGFLIAFWSTPRMSLGHLFFAVMTTAYILLAIQFEERDLLRAHGESYEQYRRRVAMLLPLPFMKKAPPPVEAKRKAAE